MVGSSSQRSRSGQKAFLELREWSGGPLEGPNIGREALPGVREWSGGPPEGPEVVERHSRKSSSARSPFRRSGRGQEALPEILQCSEALLEV